MARVLIGTSGWHYDSWRGPFFPEGLPLKEELRYYAGQFETTELNGVFYRTPTPEAVETWREQIVVIAGACAAGHHQLHHRQARGDPEPLR